MKREDGLKVRGGSRSGGAAELASGLFSPRASESEDALRGLRFFFFSHGPP